MAVRKKRRIPQPKRIAEFDDLSVSISYDNISFEVFEIPPGEKTYYRRVDESDEAIKYRISFDWYVEEGYIYRATVYKRDRRYKGGRSSEVDREFWAITGIYGESSEYFFAPGRMDLGEALEHFLKPSGDLSTLVLGIIKEQGN